MKTIKNWESFNESKKDNKKCEHKNKKNISSNKLPEDSNTVEVECLDCGMHRHETRDKISGKIETSEWFKPRK